MMASKEANVLKMIPKGFSWKFSVMDGAKTIADVVNDGRAETALAERRDENSNQLPR